jgi:hypothetical protein
MSKHTLFTADVSNPKLAKGLAANYSTIVLHLAPHTLGGRGNVCAWASVGCRAACLNTAGRGGIGAGSDDDIRAGRTNAIQAARIRRTQLFFDSGAENFVASLRKEIAAHVKRCERTGRKPAVRLNGTSDLPWERIAPELFASYPTVAFYDYTKAPVRRRPEASLPSNYSLTMSYSGENIHECVDALCEGRNVAMVFDVPKGAPLPAELHGWPVVDGDVTDLRFLDPRGVIVGLRAKGRARGSNSPFVVKVPS